MATEGKKIEYACSMNKFGAAKFCKFHFGSFFNRLEVNQETRMFDIYINEYVLTGEEAPNDKMFYTDVFDETAREDFKKYWGSSVPGFNVVMVEYYEKVKG